jgi:hypothetical protein
MEFNKIKKIGIALLVVIAIIAGFSACQKEEVNESIGVQQLLQLLEENPNVEIYVTVSNGVYSIIDKSVDKARPRLKAEYEPSDGWKPPGYMSYEQLISFLERMRDEYDDDSYEIGIKHFPGEPKPFYVFYRFV